MGDKCRANSLGADEEKGGSAIDDMDAAQLRAHISGLNTTISQLQSAQISSHIPPGPPVPNPPQPLVNPVTTPPTAPTSGGAAPFTTSDRVEELAARLAGTNRTTPPVQQASVGGTTMPDLRRDINLDLDALKKDLIAKMAGK